MTVLDDRAAPIPDARIPAAESRGGWHERRDPTEREPAGHIHAGVDLGGAPGTAVRAPEAGFVEDVGTLPARPPWTGYAPAVLIRGASGRWHLLAHLSGGSGPTVTPGMMVRLGDTVGHIGRERHVHWEVRTRARARPRAGEIAATITIDPAAWLAGEEVPVPATPFRLDPTRAPMRYRAPAVVLSRHELAALEARDWGSY